MRFKRRTPLNCMFLFGMALLIGMMAAAARPALAIDDAILAVVNDEVITVKDLKEYMKGIYAQLKIEGRSPGEINDVMAQYEYKGIEQLIEDRLILSAADKAGVVIRSKAIDDRLADIKKNYPSLQEFTAALNKEGLTVTDIRKKIENQIKGQAMVTNEVRSKVFVNPQEVTDYFNKHAAEFSNKARVFINTIFVKSGFDKEAARKKIDDALFELNNGLDFKAAITQFSELPSVGELADDQMRPEFKECIDKMKIGDVSGVIEVSNGFYVIKLEGRQGPSSATISDVKDRIYKELYDGKFRERYQNWIASLRKKAYVEIKQ